MEKPRIIISSDIGGSDPDDYQSLIHYLLYTDIVESEGILSSPPYAGRKEHIIATLKAYREDYPNLIRWGDYPRYEELVKLTYQGALEVGRPTQGKATEASQHIVNTALKEDKRPLYILVWGSLTDVAQALFDKPEIEANIRLYSIGSWNTRQDPESRNYIYQYHPKLWWIENDQTFRGMYMGVKQSDDLDNESFVSQHVAGHGTMGDFFVKQKADIKMGDTPSVLYMISPLVANVGNWDNPASPSWGGSFVKVEERVNYWRDDPKSELSINGKQGAKTVNQWREDYLRDWQKRMDRCLGQIINI